ncbi:MAG: NPCBM/NEW2 domain-containing protein [Thermoguttaceae bacterium]
MRRPLLCCLVAAICLVSAVRADEPAPVQGGFEMAMKWPTFVLDTGEFAGGAPPSSLGPAAGGAGTLEITFQPVPIGDSGRLETKLYVQLSQKESLFRKWAKVRLLDAKEPRLLKEVVLDRIPIKGRPAWSHGSREADRQIIPSQQSHPVFMPGMFVGIEFPISSVRIEKDNVVVAHRPGVYLKPGEWYTTRTAVYGNAPKGDEVRAFQRYIASHRPTPHGVHFDYNSWWTAPAPYFTEKDILGLMKVFDEKLYRAHGAAFDSFCIDMGWSAPKSIWEIDTKNFPEKFTRLQAAAEKMGSHLGAWISPSSCYPTALDIPWAKQHGYEKLMHPLYGPRMCLGGPRYAAGFKKALSELSGRCGVWQLKLDGYAVECGEKDHGHQPGDLSSEKIAEGIIAAMDAAHKANPSVWIETTCMGLNPSPWWLFHANSVIGTFGDDAPWGRVPSPVYRESYTTARDFFNLQGAALLSAPIAGQEVLGIIHQTAEPLMNDAVTVILRGHEFVPVYVNPAYMNDARWESLARLMKWTRKNETTLAETVPLLPAAWQHGGIPQCTNKGVMPRDPYGYAHIKDSAGLVMLRNPWIARQSYKLTLDESVGFGKDAAKDVSAVSIYPEPRVYAKNLKYGDTLDVPLAPYETLVLSLGEDQKLEGVPTASSIGPQIKVIGGKSTLERVSFPKLDGALGPDWTSRLGDASNAVRLECQANVRVMAPKAELLVLCEGKKSSPTPVGRVAVDGREVKPDELVSYAGWAASGLPRGDHWTFLRVPLKQGDNAVSVNEFLSEDCSRVSVWVCASKPGEKSEYPNSLPAPESISLDSVALMPSKDVASLSTQAVPAERPIERIDGVFLDTIGPVSMTQGWGKLQKNKSVWQMPMTIGGKLYIRGLGTHAPSKILYALDKKYRRFQAWAGADANNSPTVTFEVKVDGATRWQSGLMTRAEEAAWVDVDVAGAKTLELIVHDAGDPNGDHADWAEARLLR